MASVIAGNMSALVIESPSLTEQVSALLHIVELLRAEVASLRQENGELRQQVAELRCEVGYWKSRHADAVRKNVQLQAELDQAHAEIRQLQAERFGKQSEKQSKSDRSNQLEDPQATPTPKKNRGQQPDRPAPRRRDYSHLPVREETVDVPAAAQVCACCGKPLAALGCDDDSQQIEIETIVYRTVIRRQRYRRTCDCQQPPRTITAPAPPQVLPKSLCGTSMWVHLLLEKFQLQRPTQRTIEQLRMLGFDLAAGTIAAGLQRLEPLFTSIYEAIRLRHVESRYFHADETRWRVFAEKAGKTGHLWWLWLFAGEDTVMFVLDPSRSHDVPQLHFAKLSENLPEAGVSVLMVDRYAAYKAMSQVKRGCLTLAFCWAHVRRDFVRVGKGYPELTAWALVWLGRIRELYRLHRERMRHAPQSSDFISADAKLREHVTTMRNRCAMELADAKLREPCRKALVSLQEHWNGLTLFVEDPRLPLDNNRGERLIRNPALGRKNYYGSGAEWSGRLAMMLFSIFATLALWKINPRTWLTEYLSACANNGGQVPETLASFLPWQMSPSRLTELQTTATSHPGNTS